MPSTSSFIVTLPPPTPNGGLHVGHMSGPFLSGDVFSKAAMLRGERCFTTCYSDVNQSYVRVTAERQGRDPHELSAHWTRDIQETLQVYGVGLSDYFAPDAAAAAHARGLFLDLYGRSVLVKKPFPVFRQASTRRYLDEAGVSGLCPVCLAGCKCGICEACGHINDANSLVSPRVTVSGATDLEVVAVEVLVLEQERFRAAIADFYRRDSGFRTRYLWLIEDALSRPLPDFPVSLPGDWGIPVQHEDFPGQVFNAWPEIMAQLIYSYKRALDHDPALGEAPSIINFFGYDNSYFYAITHVALLGQIDGGRWLPRTTMINEFYNLDHEKFSTSNNHVVWAKDLARRHDVDAARFYAAFNVPGFEKANFNEADMAAVLDRRLMAPWRRIAAAHNRVLATRRSVSPAVSVETRRLGRSALERVFASYGLERFHLRQATEDLLHLLEFIERHAGEANRVGDTAHLLRCFALAAFPLMPRAAATLYAELTGARITSIDADDPLSFRPVPEGLFDPPRGWVESDGHPEAA